MPNDAPDIYQEGASIAFEVPYAEVTKLQRALFKERFFPFAYRRGMTQESTRDLVKSVAEGLRSQLKYESRST